MDRHVTPEDVARKCEGAKRTGSGWCARCPAHDDKQASLSISDGRQATLVYCHAGCSTASILAKLNLTVAMLYYDFDPAGRQRGSVDLNLVLKEMKKQHQPPLIDFGTALSDIMYDACVTNKMPQEVWAESMALASLEYPFLMSLDYLEAARYRSIIGDGPLFTFLRPFWEKLGRPDWFELRDYAFSKMHQVYLEHRGHFDCDGTHGNDPPPEEKS